MQENIEFLLALLYGRPNDDNSSNCPTDKKTAGKKQTESDLPLPPKTSSIRVSSARIIGAHEINPAVSLVCAVQMMMLMLRHLRHLMRSRYDKPRAFGRDFGQSNYYVD